MSWALVGCHVDVAEAWTVKSIWNSSLDETVMRDGLMDHVDALSSKINFAFGGEGKNSKLYHSKHLANLGPSAFGLWLNSRVH